jgi:hypothetical protein
MSKQGSELVDFLVTLGMMELGPEFEYSYEELNEIADRLLAGDKTVLRIGVDPDVKLKSSKVQNK